jgi:protein-tyrosine phosphatase
MLVAAPPKLDATRLVPKLYQGGQVSAVGPLLAAGFDAVVFCAVEIQPPSHLLQGVRALYCPLTDDPSRPLYPAEWMQARETGIEVAQLLREGKRVLVTCAQGRNRSGLVSAIALHILTGASGPKCVARIQKRRANALTNPQFVRALARLR